MACSVIMFAFRVCSSGHLRERERERALLYWELAMACAPCFSRLRWDLRLFFTDPVVLIGIEASRLKMLIAEGSWTPGITRIIMSFSWNVNCQVLNSGLPTGDAHQVKTLGLPECFQLKIGTLNRAYDSLLHPEAGVSN